MENFDVRKKIIFAHGYVGLPFPKLDSENIRLTPDLNRLGKAILGKNKLGEPFFQDVIIAGTRLPNEPLVTVTGRKKIVETIITGSDRRGAVKEFITSEDYNIKIQGICIDPNRPREYPIEQVMSVIKLCESISSLSIECEIVNLFDVNRIVIVDFGFDEMEGQPFSQKYYINAISDEDYYAIIDNKPRIKTTGL